MRICRTAGAEMALPWSPESKTYPEIIRVSSALLRMKMSISYLAAPADKGWPAPYGAYSLVLLEFFGRADRGAAAKDTPFEGVSPIMNPECV